MVFISEKFQALVQGYRNVSSVISSASDYMCHPKQDITALSPYSSPTLHLYIWIAKVGAALELVFTAKSSGQVLLNETATAPMPLHQHQQCSPNC